MVQHRYLEVIEASQLFYLPGNKLFQLAQFLQMNHSLHANARIRLQELAVRTVMLAMGGQPGHP